MNRLLFLGSGPMGAAALRSLLAARLPVVAAFEARQPDQTATADQSVGREAGKAGIPLHPIHHLRKGEPLETLAGYRANLLVVASCPFILNRAALGAVDAAMNIHPSLLPRFRGPNPFFWMFRHGESRSGVTAHLMDEGIDAGPIIWQEAFPLLPGETGDELFARTVAIVEQCTGSVVNDYLAGRLPPRPQDTEEATYQSDPSWSDLEVDLTWPSRRIHAFVRGVREWVPLYVRVGSSLVSVIDSRLIGDGDQPPEPVDLPSGPGWVEMTAGADRIALCLGTTIERP